jgi:hypothetical protein
VFGQLDDRTLARAPRFNVVDKSWIEPALQSDLMHKWASPASRLTPRLPGVRAYESVEAYHGSASLRSALIAEDGSRRYTIERGIQVKTGSRGALQRKLELSGREAFLAWQCQSQQKSRPLKVIAQAIIAERSVRQSVGQN